MKVEMIYAVKLTTLEVEKEPEKKLGLTRNKTLIFAMTVRKAPLPSIKLIKPSDSSGPSYS